MSTPEDRHSERNCTIQDATAETTPLLPTASDSRYSVFTKNQKRCIILAAALASAFSPLSANIYYPALNSIAKDLHVSPSQINLTITTYMVYQYINLLDEVNADSIDANQLCQGIAPTFTGSLADQAGRRPAYICCFVVYIAGNIALALQHWFPALLALRAVQSCGSSGTVALASAVAADIITSAERGAYMGFASLGNILAPSLGPIAGGLLSQYFGWQVIFWFLAAAAVLFFVPFLLFFPETCRAIVEDGSIKPTGWNRSLSSWFKERSSERSRTAEPCAVPRKELDIPNPLSSLKLLLQRPVGLILMVNGLVFGSYYAVTAGIPVQFEALYGLDDLKIGLCFIPAGMGSLLTATVNGILVDWNYRRALVRTGQQVHINYKHNILSFPIERARLQVGIPMTVSSQIEPPISQAMEIDSLDRFSGQCS